MKKITFKDIDTPEKFYTLLENEECAAEEIEKVLHGRLSSLYFLKFYIIQMGASSESVVELCKNCNISFGIDIKNIAETCTSIDVDISNMLEVIGCLAVHDFVKSHSKNIHENKPTEIN